MTEQAPTRFVVPFNGPVEIGLRALAILSEAFPVVYSMQRLIVCDYLVVHSDDIADGPPGLHPKTPHRGGELLVRRNFLHNGLLLYQSRGLIERRFTQTGVFFSATEQTASFLDAMSTDYVTRLRQRASWLVARFGALSDTQMQEIVRENIGNWGAEFEMESVLWEEESP